MAPQRTRKPAAIPLPGIPLRRRPAPPPRSVEEYRAWDLCRAAYDLISKRFNLGVSKTDWLRRNNNAARELVRGGRTTEETVDALRWCYEDERGQRYFGRLSNLTKLIEHWPTITSMRLEEKGVRLRPGEVAHALDDGTVIVGNANDPAPLYELRRAGGL